MVQRFNPTPLAVTLALASAGLVATSYSQAGTGDPADQIHANEGAAAIAVPDGEPAIVVTSAADDGPGTLRHAIAQIQADPKLPRLIRFDASLEGADIGIVAPLRIETALEIRNEHPGLVRIVKSQLPEPDGNSLAHRRFLIIDDGDDLVESEVTLSGLALVGASTYSTELYSDPLDFTVEQASGAAILSREPLRLTRCLISGAEARSEGLSIHGSAIATIRDLEIDGCEIADNAGTVTNYYPVLVRRGVSASGCGSIGGACGPIAVVGIAGAARPVLTLTDTSLLRNVSLSVTDGNQPFSGFASGVFVSNADAIVTRTTFSENVARNEVSAGPPPHSSGAAIHVDGGHMDMTDSRVLANRSEFVAFDGTGGEVAGAIYLAANGACAAPSCAHSIQRTVVRGNAATIEQSEAGLAPVFGTVWTAAGSGLYFNGGVGWNLDVSGTEFSNGHSDVELTVSVNLAAQTRVDSVGAVVLNGVARIVNSTVSGNHANSHLLHLWESLGQDQSAAVQMESRAGGIHIGAIDGQAADVSIEIDNTTIADNRAAAAFDMPLALLPTQSIEGAVLAEGGGIHVRPDADLTLRSSLVVNNDLTSVSGPHLDRVLSGIDLRGSITASHSMLSTLGVGSSNFQDGVDGNVVGDPGIAPLRDNGGPTWTHRISRESIAIDAGSLVLALSSDQRGFEPRVVGADADMGALECGAVAVSVDADRLFADGFDAYCD